MKASAGGLGLATAGPAPASAAATTAAAATAAAATRRGHPLTRLTGHVVLRHVIPSLPPDLSWP